MFWVESETKTFLENEEELCKIYTLKHFNAHLFVTLIHILVNKSS